WLSSLVVEIRGRPEAARAWAAEVAPAIARAAPDLIERALAGAPELAAFFRAHKWLYAPLVDLKAIDQRLELDIDKAENPLFRPLDEPPPLADTAKRLSERRSLLGALPDGRFESARGDLLALVVLPARDAGNASADRIEQAVVSTIARHPPPPGVALRLS